MTRSLSLAALVVLLLRAAPAAVAWLAPEPAGEARIPVGYIPKDFLQYVAFIREAAETGSWWLANPFTTAPQDDRFLLLFLAALGNLCRATGLDPFVALELSRLPVYALFFAALGAFLREALPGRAARVWAVWLVALSGGFGFLGRLAVPLLPEAAADSVALNLWSVYGWSTFESLHNPMWTLGLAITLAIFRACLRPEGPRGPGEVLWTSLGLALLYAVHAYSAIVVVAVLGVRILLDLRSGEPGRRRVAGRLAGALAPGLLAVAATALYQLGDPAFRASAGGVLGTQLVSLLWYPLGLGLLGVLAWIGFGHGRGEPWTRGLVVWAGTVAVLHNLPVLNGYHFLFHLHLPLAIVAARAAPATFRAARPAGRAALLLGLFLSSAAVSVEAVADVVRVHLVPRAWIDAARALGERPRGNVLAPQPVGNVIPAWGAHRVWVGHWFLTPDARERARRVERLFAAPRERAAALRALVSRERIRYLVVPAERVDDVAAVLGDRTIEREGVGELVLLVPGD